MLLLLADYCQVSEHTQIKQSNSSMLIFALDWNCPPLVVWKQYTGDKSHCQYVGTLEAWTKVYLPLDESGTVSGTVTSAPVVPYSLLSLQMHESSYTWLTGRRGGVKVNLLVMPHSCIAKDRIEVRVKSWTSRPLLGHEK